jgi:protease PrsW
VWLTLLLTGTQVQWLLIQLGRAPAVTQTQVHLFTILNWVLLALDGLLGLVALRGRWRKATALDRSGSAAAVALVTAERSEQ